MPSFNKRSLEKLRSAHPDLQRLFLAVIAETDCTILCGHRGKEEQQGAYQDGLSKLQWPDSKHNKLPSLAVDASPYPIDWKNTERFLVFGRQVLAKANELGLKIRWGADWDMDGDTTDQRFMDLVHFELAP